MSPTPTPRRLDGLSRRAALWSCLALLGSLVTLPVRAEQPTPSDFIQALGSETVAILRQTDVSDARKVDALVDVLNRATNLPLVARLVLGPHWRQATDPQRQEYIELFRDLVVKTMADRLGSYRGETFEITGQRAVDERDTLVSTRITSPARGAAPIAVDWRVRRTESSLAIIDIIAEGVSMVVTQRAEVGSVVGQKGIDGLIVELRARLAQRA
jgi:phospholipid transport system substrate-binding protein